MNDVRLTPIGTSPAWYNAGIPCSGYLLDANGYRVLVDCGSGVITSYLSHFPNTAIDAVVISHVHPDHCFDLIPLKYAMEYGALSSWAPQLWLPEGGHERLIRLADAWDAPEHFFAESFDVQVYSPRHEARIGPFSMQSRLVPHFIESFAMRFSTGGTTFAYSSDLEACPEIIEVARDADLFLCEAVLPDRGPAGAFDHPHSGSAVRGHLSPHEAGEIARRAGAHSLLLTHVPVERDPELFAERAREEYDGPVALARPLTEYVLSQRLSQVG